MSGFAMSATVKARAEHRCDQCGRVIRAGESYSRVKSLDSDGWSIWRSCGECDRCVSDLWNIGVGDEDDWGGQCYAHLPDVDWADVAATHGPVWTTRGNLFHQRWAGQPYPEHATEVTP